MKKTFYAVPDSFGKFPQSQVVCERFTSDGMYVSARRTITPKLMVPKSLDLICLILANEVDTKLATLDPTPLNSQP